MRSRADFGPNHFSGAGVVHGGCAFQEDCFAVDKDQMEAPVSTSRCCS